MLCYVNISIPPYEAIGFPDAASTARDPNVHFPRAYVRPTTGQFENDYSWGEKGVHASAAASNARQIYGFRRAHHPGEQASVLSIPLLLIMGPRVHWLAWSKNLRGMCTVRSNIIVRVHTMNTAGHGHKERPFCVPQWSIGCFVSVQPRQQVWASVSTSMYRILNSSIPIYRCSISMKIKLSQRFAETS